MNKSVVYCSAVFCSNNSRKNSEVLYHNFPKNNKTVFVKWNKFCGRPNINKGHICSNHFVDSDYDILKIALDGNSGPVKRLRSGAIPSVKKLKESQCTARSVRKNIRERNIIVRDAIREFEENGKIEQLQQSKSSENRLAKNIELESSLVLMSAEILKLKEEMYKLLNQNKIQEDQLIQLKKEKNEFKSQLDLCKQNTIEN